MCRINNLANTLTEYIMIKTKTILMAITVFVALLIGSCEKEDNSPDDNNKNTGTQFIADYSVAKDSVLRSIPREYIDTARTTHNISQPTGKLMQCGGYWQELPAGTESEEVGSKNRIPFCLTSIKKPKPHEICNLGFVPRTRIELARPKSVTRPSTWRVYQFRHLGITR